MPNDEIHLEGAVDLADVKARADERDRLEEEAKTAAAIEAAQRRAALWDKAMRRAFKGIMPRPQARAALTRSLMKMEAEENAS